ncbi:uncharacterized protein [Euwallacea fornicatus]|uniref:uncharacterized protein n=1 Tax=Euwallacea fornicatus TaxID=995702 RepID=UPI00338F6F51
MASAGELKGLNVARRTCKAQLTMFSKFLERLDVSSGLGAEKIGQIIERLDKLEGTFERFGTIQSELELHADDYDDELAERDDFENRYFELKAKGKGLLQKFSRVDASTAGGTSQGAESPSPLDNIKLPVISLPTFSGDFKDWLGFRDLYLSLIHNNDRLSRIQKFHYLRASLRDAASRVLGTLELSEGNYDIAWTTLSERYDNKRVLVHIHLKTLVEVESMHRESAPKLRSLIDSVSKSLIALTALGQKPENWGVLVAYLISTKLDPVTERQWEEAKSTHKEVPSWDSLREFLSARADMLEAIDRQRGNNSKPERNVGLKPNKTSAKTFVGSDISCGVCKAKHSLVKCPSFLAMSPNERFGKVKQLKVCFNCLKPGHSVKDCRLRNCSKCPAKHHTLLHFEPVRVQDDAPKPVESLEHQVSLSSLSSDNHVFLSTVLVDVVSAEGKRLKVRALLDSGSQSNFITSSLCKRLKTKLGDFEVIVGGLGSKASEVKHCCHIEVCARHSGYKSSLKCLVLPRITGFIPGAPVNISRLNIPSNITLADPEFSKPGPIDLLIGSELFYGLLCVGQISLGPHNPILQKTRFGWIVSGSMANPGSINSICNLSTNSRPSGSNIDFDLKKFWEVEDNFSETKAWSAEELECEEHFQRTHRRSVDGRFMVAIPLKHPVADLGNSKTKALHRFLSLERKLSRDSALREEYCSFMREYSSLGHMTRVLDEDDRVSYYMPHHPVIKTESCTTKLRVVFDCSMPSSTGKSLNDLQMVGPVIQSDLFDILIRFREFRFVVSADIAKMYRQVFVEPKQRSLQRIFWRESPSDPIEVFELNTVTYGQASASFLAVRCLHQVAQESELDVASVIKSSFYVDDFLHSINSVEEGIRMCHRVSAALVGGRLRNSAYQFNKKHPMLLSPKHRLTRMLCEHEHRRLMHAGPQLLLASLREKYWVVAARNLIRAVVRNCVTCSRFNPQYLAPLMGDLPPSRLTGGSVFAFVGVDYMGPLNIRDKRGRGSRLSKCYVSVFICFATKALHLELVSDLSSESFLLAFRRFVARRGRPSHVYSDNGTNFVGANRELAELGHFLIKESSKLANSYAQEGVQWHFIPPQSPHFGGLWEAGVKSVKHHLKRVAGNANLTFEHLITLLAQIESILNSRPLSPLSQDPNDLTPLSPAHFLIGRSLTELPDPDLQHIPANRLSVFQRIQQIKQHLWTRWSKEYVSELQQRVKWKARQQDVQEGVLVLVKEDNLPPSKWRMGRVVAVHPGQDGVNRVATLRTSSGLVKRSFSKICPLPTNTVIEDAASASRPGAC